MTENIEECCRHAFLCDKCNLYSCSDEQILHCKNECKGICDNCTPSIISCCIDSWTWYCCENDECKNDSKKNRKKCSVCSRNCRKFTKKIDGGFMCKRCAWIQERETFAYYEQKRNENYPHFLTKK
jgi:hypothetical protein